MSALERPADLDATANGAGFARARPAPSIRPVCGIADLGGRADAGHCACIDRHRGQRRGMALRPPVGPAQSERHHALPAHRRCGIDGNRRRRHGLAGGGVRLSRPALLLMGAGAAACRAALSGGLCLRRILPLHRPGAGPAALAVRLREHPRLLVSGHTLHRRRRFRHGLGALPVCLSHHTHRLSHAGPQHRRRGAHAGRLAVQGVLARAAAGGTAGDRRRRRAGADGNHQRHRRIGISRRADAHRVGLFDLAQPRQSRRWRGNRPGDARACARAACSRKQRAAQAALACRARHPHEDAAAAHPPQRAVAAAWQ